MLNNDKIMSKYILSLLYDTKIPEELPEEFSHIEGLKEIDDILRKLRSTIRLIGLGDLSDKIEGKGYTFGIIKNLQASLKNLTWQTKAISSGDFSQRINFLGDFSDAFNNMTIKLETSIMEVKEARDLFKMFFETIPDATMIVSSKNWNILDCNPAFEKMTGYSKEYLYCKSLKEIDFFKDEIQEELFSNSIAINKKVEDILVELKSQDQPLIYGLLSSDTIVIEKEKHILIIIKNITERKRMEEEIRKISETDKLTGINNRLKLDEILNLELNRLSRSKSVCSILLLDIDYFKKVNDTYGHLAGDEVLKELAQIIKTSVREIDTVGRWGGEEFVIIMPSTDVNGAKTVAEKLRKQISEYNFTYVGKITVSAGVAESRGKLSREQLVGRADIALYEAKNKGRNQVCKFL